MPLSRSVGGMRCGQRSRTRERAGELGEDGQVGGQAHALNAPGAEWGERPFVLEPAELALDGGALAVEALPAKRLAGDQRVQAVGLDPPGGGLALAGWAAPLGGLTRVVCPGETPLAMLAARWLVL